MIELSTLSLRETPATLLRKSLVSAIWIFLVSPFHNHRREWEQRLSQLSFHHNRTVKQAQYCSNCTCCSSKLQPLPWRMTYSKVLSRIFGRVNRRFVTPFFHDQDRIWTIDLTFLFSTFRVDVPRRQWAMWYLCNWHTTLSSPYFEKRTTYGSLSRPVVSLPLFWHCPTAQSPRHVTSITCLSLIVCAWPKVLLDGFTKLLPQ